MPLALVTGPANAAKAGAVLARFRAALPRRPLLVVPTEADAEHYARELAREGAAVGGEVVTFGRLAGIIAAAAGVGGRPLGAVARERVVRAAIRDARLRALAGASGVAASAGFVAAAGAFLAELERALVPPARFAAALRAWGAAEGRAAYAEDLARLYAAYRRRLERLGHPDADGYLWAALDGLRARPASWARRPVLLYGFDDLTPLELDAVEALAGPAEAEVCVALPHEPGRLALAGTAPLVERLRPLAAEPALALPARAEHYAPDARPALHHLERRLFEPDPVRVAPRGAVRLLEAAGERAEAELVGAEVLALAREGFAWEDVAVLVRGDRRPFAEVLQAYGVPVASRERVALEGTRLGAGVLAAARATLAGGTAGDLLAWLRTPGRVPDPGPVDALETAVRRRDVRGVAEARALWGAGRAPLAALDALTDAAAAGPGAFLAALEAEAEAIWTAPLRRRGAVLDGEAERDARAAAALRAAAADLRALAAAAPDLLADAAAVLEALAGVEVREAAGEGGVALLDPLGIRARRFRAVFVCGLQAGELSRAATPDPFLDDEDRRGLALAGGLALPPREDVLARERSLFYACASRPRDRLYLAWRSATEEGDPVAASPFLEEVRALFGEELWTGRRRRTLAEVTWSPAEAPTPHELARARALADPAPEPAALAPPAAPAVLAALAARDTVPARGLETFALCGVRWLVEDLLRPERVLPDPEPMRAGSVAHALLERTLRRLAERTGSARLDPGSLPAAEAELEGAVAELGAALPPAGAVPARAALHALRADVRRVLREEAEGGAGLEPAHLEWGFGGERDEHGPLALAGVAVTGRVDRIDVGADGRSAIVRDYKHRRAGTGASWAQEGRLQVALYALAARALLGLDPVAALYQPLGGKDLRPRGLSRAGTPGSYVATDVVDEEGFAAGLAEARALAERAAEDLRAGRVRPCPERCTPAGCAYPGICRAGEEG